ncbi:thioredoxin-related transmembrane protein 4 [Gastrophryne carolinensis]
MAARLCMLGDVPPAGSHIGARSQPARHSAARGRPHSLPHPRSVTMAASRATAAMLGTMALGWVFGLCWAEEGAVSILTASNWSLTHEGHWMLQFYAPWCPACQQIQSDWENFAKRGPVLNVQVAKVDVTAEPGLSGRFFVTKLPTIFHAKDGIFRRYHGSRMLEDLHTFIAEKKWELMEPVAGWKSPSSVLMTGMAGLFHLSGWIRQTHNYFTGPLGIPAWGSYIIFIMGTLLLGLILGLILVLLLDCFCPAKQKYEVLSSDIAKQETDDVDEDEKKVSDDEDVIDEASDDCAEEKDDEQSGDNEGEDSNGAAKDSAEDSAVEDSGTEEEEDLDDQAPEPRATESESALRQRKTEAVVESGH